MSIKEVVKDARLALSDRIKVTLREEILQNKVMNVARHLIIANHERQPRLQVLTLPGWHMVGLPVIYRRYLLRRNQTMFDMVSNLTSEMIHFTKNNLKHLSVNYDSESGRTSLAVIYAAVFTDEKYI